MSLTKGSVFQKLCGLWLPMIVGVFSVKAIDLADAYYVGQLGGDSLAAIGYTFPVMLTLISLSLGLSSGASSILSRAIGSSSSKQALQEIISGAVAFALAISLLLAVLGGLLIEPLFRVMGASGEVLELALSYMYIWFAGTAFLIIPIAATGLIRATGDGLTPAAILVSIAVLNIGLNPLFIFGAGPIPALGVAGAAIATVLARAVAAAAVIWILWRKEMLVLSGAVWRAGMNRWQEIAALGLPASLSTSVNPMALSVATSAVATLGAAEVAAFGTATRIESFVIVPMLALSAASAPMVGQNSGAGETERSRQALRWCAGISVSWTLLIALFLMFFSQDLLLPAFTDDAEIQSLAATYLRIVALSLAGYGITVALSAGMNGLGRANTALTIGAGRALVLLAPGVWLGVELAGFAGAAVAIALANVLAGIIAVVVIERHSLKAVDNTNESNKSQEQDSDSAMEPA